MPTILPPITGKKVDKVHGNGSAVLITDEVLAVLTPVRVNSTPGCICIKLHDSQGCADVRVGMPQRHIDELSEELADEGHSFVYLTMPQVFRATSDSWTAAAAVLQALTNVALAQAAKTHAEEVKAKPKKASK